VLLLTLGHGTLDQEAFSALVTGAEIDVVVDIRTHPGSRRHPHFSSDAMPGWLPVDYRWERRLGGRRKARPDSPHVALRHEAFRGYADHMEGDDFRTTIVEDAEAIVRSMMERSEAGQGGGGGDVVDEPVAGDPHAVGRSVLLEPPVVEEVLDLRAAEEEGGVGDEAAVASPPHALGAHDDRAG